MGIRKPETALAEAIAAARDFKQLLDIQAPGTLFFPRHKGDARTTAIYETASRLLHKATAQDLEAADGVGFERRITLPLTGVVTKQRADVPPNQLQLFAGITAAIAELAFQVLDEYRSRGKHGGSLEIVVRAGGKADVVLKEVEGKGNAVHGLVSEEIDRHPLCHGSNNSSEAPQ